MYFVIFVYTIFEVIQMSKKYSGLRDLIQEDYEAKVYFLSLPEYVQGQIQQREDHVNSFASLQDYAENLLRGDD